MNFMQKKYPQLPIYLGSFGGSESLLCYNGQFPNTHVENRRLYCLGMVGLRFSNFKILK